MTDIVRDEIDGVLGIEPPVETPGPGIYCGVSFSDYCKWDAVNASLLKTVISASPAHALYERDHPTEDTAALRFGRLLHTAVLEPVRFEDTVKVLPPDAPARPTEAMRNAKNPSASSVERVAFWDRWEAAGYETITPAEMDQLSGMMRSIAASQCKTYVTGGQAEVCAIWIDAKTGLKCKGRLDFLQQNVWGQGTISDIKSCRDAGEGGFRNAIKSYGYDLQAAFYVDGMKTLVGEDYAFVFVACEKDPPYVSKPWECGERTMQAGRNKYRKALDTWGECLKTHTFPAYGDEVEIIEMSEWDLERAGVSRFQVFPQ